MDTPPIQQLIDPAVIEHRAAKAGISISDLCLNAEISQAVWYRWRKGDTKIRLLAYYRLLQALDIAEARAVSQASAQAAS